MPRTKKPQISAETTADFQSRFDEFCASQPASKRLIIETSINNYVNEARGRRLAFDMSDSMQARVAGVQAKQGLRTAWLIEQALDQFLTARESTAVPRLVVDLSDRVARRLSAYRRIRSNPEPKQLVEDALDNYIENDLKYNEDLKQRFTNALDEIARDEPN
ncbi:MAG TPA: hypothetical protein VF883_19785 [Thermoanaerobaculia bacterium]|jgi:hypothetical protein